MASLGNFLQSAGLAAGNIINYNLAANKQLADTELKQQQVAQGRMAMLQQQQIMDARAQVMRESATDRGADIASVQDPLQEAAKADNAAVKLLRAGDFEGAKVYESQATSLRNAAKSQSEEAVRREKLRNEAVANTAQTFVANPTPENAQEFLKADTAAGGDLTKTARMSPQELLAYARGKQLASMTAAERAKFLQAEADRQQAREDRKQAHEEARADHLQAHRDTMMLREGMQELQRSKVSFEEEEKLNASTQRAAKPYLEDRQRIADIKGLLSVDSSAADQQVHQALTAVLGNFKGRATNLFYKDNKNFGDVVQRLSGWASHTFTGRYDEQSRRDIYNMLDQMERQVVDPALTNLEKNQQEKAKRYNLRPENIAIQGDFNRVGEKPKEAPAAGTVKTVAGVKYRSLGNGKWEVVQ